MVHQEITRMGDSRLFLPRHCGGQSGEPREFNRRTCSFSHPVETVLRGHESTFDPQVAEIRPSIRAAAIESGTKPTSAARIDDQT